MLHQFVGHRFDLTADSFVLGDEIVDRCSQAEQLAPPGLLGVGIQFGSVETADRADHVAQRVASGTKVLVAHAVQHLIGQGGQFLLGTRSELDNRLGVAHVQFGHTGFDRRFFVGIGLVIGHDVCDRLG